MQPHERIIVALDVPTLKEARALVEKLSPHVGFFKVGLQLATSVGAPQVVEAIQDCGGRVFLDLKFNDIPNTVGEASKAAVACGVFMFNVHASAGIAAMKAAVANKDRSLVLAVTVLTSFDEKDCSHIFGDRPAVVVPTLAEDALEAGCDGIICSPKELVLFKDEKFVRLLKVVPGIRPEWARTDDQKRFTTPMEAIKAGADYLVIGRPITKPPDGIGSPAAAAQRVAAEIAVAHAELGL
ncbi:MAG: orotidine-5'-phosphate decarboxylase [bacterium]|nr:orotidine-5'-phosphate decarboxylase [bacterium]